MSLDNRKRSLEQRHAQADDQLHAELTRPASDPAVINALRREKLRIKDQIQAMQAMA